MASHKAKGLFHKAIGESGAMFGERRYLKPLANMEKDGVQFAKSVGAGSLKELRAKSADEILKVGVRKDTFHFGAIQDGVFLPESVEAIFEKGNQSHVPLLAGWNLDEGGWQGFFKGDEPTAESYAKHAKEEFKDNAKAFLGVYRAKTAGEAKRAAADLSGDQFIGFATWKWLEAQAADGREPVYRYKFDQVLPVAPGAKGEDAVPRAPHASEIEFVFGALASKKLPWRPEDWRTSELMMDYWSNFAKTGDPNGPGLPKWPVYDAKGKYQVMHLTAQPKPAADAHRGRYKFLEKVDSKE